jgi:hypothetical protein
MARMADIISPIARKGIRNADSIDLFSPSVVRSYPIKHFIRKKQSKRLGNFFPALIECVPNNTATVKTFPEVSLLKFIPYNQFVIVTSQIKLRKVMLISYPYALSRMIRLEALQ